jgi:hypothetical protein
VTEFALPETHALSGEVNIAYQVMGDGPEGGAERRQPAADRLTGEKAENN